NICMFDFFFFSSRRRHTRSKRDWSSDVCSSDLSLQLFPVMPPMFVAFLKFLFPTTPDLQNVRSAKCLSQPSSSSLLRDGLFALHLGHPYALPARQINK